MTHYNNPAGHLADLSCYGFLVITGRSEHCMKSYYERYLQLVEQGKDIHPVQAAEYSKFMFQDTDVCSAIVDRFSSFNIIPLMFLADGELNFRRIIIFKIMIIHGNDESFMFVAICIVGVDHSLVQ